MMRRDSGFTLIELMIVVVIVGILVAIALPNYSSMSNRARTASVKNNMHVIHVAAEDFSSRNGGVYPANAASTTAEGALTLVQLLPSATVPMNPFTQAATTLSWGVAQGSPYGGADLAGGIQINTWSMSGGAVDCYEILGEDEFGMITYTLTNR
jgi:prepilin-type N-terminal cleavage/methylation domain-containing protein